jgi:hypothetical protein
MDPEPRPRGEEINHSVFEFIKIAATMPAVSVLSLVFPRLTGMKLF